MPLNSKIQPTPARSLASISLLPTNIQFANQNEDEQVVLLIRQHKVIFFGYFIRFIFRLLLPIIIFAFVGWLFSLNFMKDFTFHVRSIYILIITILWWLWSFSRFFSDFLYWYYNAYIVTSERLIDLDFLSVFNHSIKELDLRNIEDAVDSHEGVLQTIFDMGRVVIRTASETTVFTLNNVPKSSKVRDFIMDLSIYSNQGGGSKP